MEDIQVKQNIQEYLPEKQIREHENSVDTLNRQVMALVVHDQATETQAAEILGQARRAQTNIDSVREAIVTPFNSHIRKINSFFKALAGSYDPIVETVTRKMKDYRRAEDKKRAEQAALDAKRIAEQNRKARDRAKEKGVDPEILQRAPIVQEQPKTIESATTRVSYVEVPAYRIKPEAHENPCKYVPAEYIKIDEQKLAAAVRAKLIKPGDYKWGNVFIDRKPRASRL